MNAFRKSIIGCIVGTLAVAAMASGAPQQKPQTRDIAMVVHVSTQGQVTEFQSAQEMPRWEHALVMQKLDQWITKPATNKHGKPISSRFIMQLAMTTTQRSDGNYDATFKLLQTMPVGFPGPVHWNDVDHGRYLYLVSDVGSAPQEIPIGQPLNAPTVMPTPTAAIAIATALQQRHQQRARSLNIARLNANCSFHSAGGSQGPPAFHCTSTDAARSALPAACSNARGLRVLMQCQRAVQKSADGTDRVPDHR